MPITLKFKITEDNDTGKYTATFYNMNKSGLQALSLLFSEGGSQIEKMASDKEFQDKIRNAIKGIETPDEVHNGFFEGCKKFGQFCVEQSKAITAHVIGKALGEVVKEKINWNMRN